MYNASKYDMYNYDIKYNHGDIFYLIIKYRNFLLRFCKNVWKIGTSYGILARLSARWQVKMRSWHAFGTLARRHFGP